MGQVCRRLFGLCLPSAAAASLDAVLTLRGQSAEYWAGNYARVNELSPTFHHLLAYHPLAFVAGILAWLLIFGTIILLLPRMLALAMSLAVTIGHTWGATTWLLHRFHYGYQACEALFVLTALVSAVGIERIWARKPRQRNRLDRACDLPCAGGWSRCYPVSLAIFFSGRGNREGRSPNHERGGQRG